MRVMIDARSVHPPLHGVGRHVLNLLLGLSHVESDLEFLILHTEPFSRKVLERAGGPFRNRFQWVKSRSRDSGSWIQSAEIPWLLKIHRADLFHDIATSGAWTARTPEIVTVHELAAPDRNSMRRLLRQAKLVVAVSQTLAEEIETQFNISRPKIRVIGNGIDPWYMERTTENEIRAMRERLQLRGKYFLCVTADRPTKNMELVRQAAKLWKGEEQFAFTALGATESPESRQRYLGTVEDTWLRPLYAACAGVIVPSLYEGFSIPPIEAMATGSIPVVSNIPPHRELLGKILPESLFFDPKDPVSLMRVLQAVLDGGETLRASVLEKFRMVRDRYSVIETAKQVQAVYHEVKG